MAQEDTTSILPSDKPQAEDKNAAPQPGTPEYDAAMVAKFEQHTGKGGDQSTPSVKPEGVPEKFWDAEKGVVRTDDLLKSYRELEKLNTQKTQEATKEVPKVEPKDGLKLDDKEGQKEQNPSEVTPLQMEKFSNEFFEKGELSEDSYTELEKAGIPKAYVDAYIEGQKALMASRDNAGYNLVGGEENFNKMATWAKQNLSVADRQAFNNAVAGTDAEMKMAILGLKSQYEAANGREPSLAGGAAASSGVSGYESKAQMTADMRDPRYAKDEAFRAKVQQKLANTTAF